MQEDFRSTSLVVEYAPGLVTEDAYWADTTWELQVSSEARATGHRPLQISQQATAPERLMVQQQLLVSCTGQLPIFPKQ